MPEERGRACSVTQRQTNTATHTQLVTRQATSVRQLPAMHALVLFIVDNHAHVSLLRTAVHSAAFGTVSTRANVSLNLRRLNRFPRER